MYEYLLTFGAEVEYFWHGRFTKATLLFFANRYTHLTAVFVDITSALIETKSNLVSDLMIAHVLHSAKAGDS